MLLSWSASSTLCGGCCDAQAVVGTSRALVGVLRCAWPVLLKNCARSVAETKPNVRGCVLAQAAMLAGCKTLSVGSASKAIVDAAVRLATLAPGSRGSAENPIWRRGYSS